jgi:predicted NBD/HSP70 family sugar kinase
MIAPVEGNGALAPSQARPDGRAQVIDTLSKLGASSRAELARRTGLSPSTVSGLVAKLLDEGLVVERDGEGAANPRGGRPPVLVALGRGAGVVLGLDFGKRHLRVALSDLGHNLLVERVRELDRDQPAAAEIAAAVELVEEALTEARADHSQVVGVGMGLPGPVQRTTGELGDSTILPGWVGVRAGEAMEKALGLPVEVENDANLGALSEWMWGAGRGCDQMAYLKIATGIGAGLILDGRPFVGAGGTAGEIGHTPVEPGGPICRCGNRGCLETVAAVPSVLESLRSTHGDDLTIRDVIAGARNGDAGCRRAIADAGQTIGTAAANLCNLVNLERLVVGGDLGAAGELLLVPLREALERAAIRSAATDVELVEGALGERSEVLGAVALALRNATPLESLAV